MTKLRSAYNAFASGRPSRQTAWLVSAGLLFLILSAPLNLLHGYLLAEEGTTYFRYARLAEPLRALFAPHQQYFSAFPNAVSFLVARVLPLRWAAVTSAWLVLCIHVWLVFMVSQCERFTSAASRALAVGVVLLISGAAPTQVGTTHAQFIFALICIVVLLSDVERHRAQRTLAVLLGGIDGVVSCVLTPFFLYRAWRTRSRLAWLQAIFLCVCSVAQALVLRSSLPFATRDQIAHRSVPQSVDVIANHMLVLPFLSRLVYHPVALLGEAHTAVTASFFLVSLCLFSFLVVLLWPAGKPARMLMLIAAVHAACCLSGMEGAYAEVLGGGERYFYVANAAVAFALVLRWQQGHSSASDFQARVAGWLLVLVAVSGCGESLRFWKTNQSGPVWAEQLARWRTDPARVSLTGNPAIWASHRMYLTPEPMYLRLPFYIFDSNTRADVLQSLPQGWFGPTPGIEHLPTGVVPLTGLGISAPVPVAVAVPVR